MWKWRRRRENKDDMSTFTEDLILVKDVRTSRVIISARNISFPIYGFRITCLNATLEPLAYAVSWMFDYCRLMCCL